MRVPLATASFVAWSNVCRLLCRPLRHPRCLQVREYLLERERERRGLAPPPSDYLPDLQGYDGMGPLGPSVSPPPLPLSPRPLPRSPRLLTAGVPLGDYGSTAPATEVGHSFGGGGGGYGAYPPYALQPFGGYGYPQRASTPVLTGAHATTLQQQMILMQHQQQQQEWFQQQQEQQQQQQLPLPPGVSTYGIPKGSSTKALTRLGGPVRGTVSSSAGIAIAGRGAGLTKRGLRVEDIEL